MIAIGLTGGIGTGKSAVSSYLGERGCFIIDADKMARGMTEKGSPALDKIREVFGGEYFNEAGELDRKKLGNLVFNQPEKKEDLERIITRRVIEETEFIMAQLLASDFQGVVIVDAPLLFECGMDEIMAENWVVTCDTDVRIERVMSRDNLSRQQVLDRINNQMPESEKLKLADRIIDNSGTLEDLYETIDIILEDEGLDFVLEEGVYEDYEEQ